MSLRWLYSFSFRSLPLFVVALCGCIELADSGGSDSSSELTCSGDGGLFPNPVGPQSFPEPEKFAISENIFHKSLLLANTPLVAVVDEICVREQPAGSPKLSQILRPEIEAQGSPSDNRAYSFKMPAAYSVAQISAMANQDPCLLQLSEDTQVTLSETVNDPQFSLQNHLTNIDAPTAWDTLHLGLTGSVVIAIIDNGTELTHSDLSGAIWVNPDEIAANGIDDDGNGYIDDINGYNFRSNIASPAPQAGAYHGTHVAGLAAAIGNNSNGISGVMGRNAQIMVLNVFGTAAGASSANIVNAINYARIKGADVINLSLGGLGTSGTVNTAMINAVAAGSFIAIAAGNDNTLVTSGTFYMPMGYAKDIDGAMSVGSIDATTSLRSSFSNYSTTYVEIGAPGSNTATGGLLSTYTGNTYNYLQGTSMASPVLAGSAALLIGWARSAGKTITPAQVETIIKSSANSSAPLSSYFLGGGALNLNNVVAVGLCNL